MRGRCSTARCLIVLAAALLLTASASPGRAQSGGEFTPVTDAMLQDPAPGDWLMWRRTLDGWGFRCMGLTKIDTKCLTDSPSSGSPRCIPRSESDYRGRQLPFPDEPGPAAEPPSAFGVVPTVTANRTVLSRRSPRECLQSQPTSLWAFRPMAFGDRFVGGDEVKVRVRPGATEDGERRVAPALGTDWERGERPRESVS